METARSMSVEKAASGPMFRAAAELHEECIHHGAFAELRSFNAQFAARPLQRHELLLFMSSMAAFNRHTIGGIAILAGRLSDQILPLLPRNGHEIGARVLDAAVDEYGLRESVTHVELARQFTEYLGIAAEDVEARDNACSAARELGDALFAWYRNSPVALSLGVHAASEATSVEEFASWHDTFLKFPQYRFSRDVPEFEYMRAHYVHEPGHIDSAKYCFASYLEVLPGERRTVRRGLRDYLDLYQKMFRQLNARIFGLPANRPA
jgi:pyrroloquinoline quinone (PQQ) biosynthesis protein C